MKWFKKYAAIANISLTSSFAYAKPMITNILFYFMLIYVFLMLWRVIYSGGNGVPGYDLSQMIWYLIVTEMIWTIKGVNFEDINNDIKSGSIAYLLNKPYNYVLYLISNSIGEFGAKFVVSIVAGIVMGLIYVGPLKGFSAVHLPFILISGIMAILLNFFILIPLALSAFWTEENAPFRWIYSKLTLILGVMLPVEFFPQWIQPYIKALPFLYTTYGPAKLVVDFSYVKFFEIFIYQIVYLVIFIGVTFAVYNKGVRRLNVNGG